MNKTNLKQKNEKVLRGRKRKKASKGEAVRLSDAVIAYLNRQNNNRGLSYDALMRKLFGLPDRKGASQRLIEGYLIPASGAFHLRTKDYTEADANGDAIIAAAKKKSKKVHAPILMREVP